MLAVSLPEATWVHEKRGAQMSLCVRVILCFQTSPIVPARLIIPRE